MAKTKECAFVCVYIWMTAKAHLIRLIPHFHEQRESGLHYVWTCTCGPHEKGLRRYVRGRQSVRIWCSASEMYAYAVGLRAHNTTQCP